MEVTGKKSSMNRVLTLPLPQLLYMYTLGVNSENGFQIDQSSMLIAFITSTLLSTTY